MGKQICHQHWGKDEDGTHGFDRTQGKVDGQHTLWWCIAIIVQSHSPSLFNTISVIQKWLNVVIVIATSLTNVSFKCIIGSARHLCVSGVLKVFWDNHWWIACVWSNELYWLHVDNTTRSFCKKDIIKLFTLSDCTFCTERCRWTAICIQTSDTAPFSRTYIDYCGICRYSRPNSQLDTVRHQMWSCDPSFQSRECGHSASMYLNGEICLFEWLPFRRSCRWSFNLLKRK